MISNTHLYKKNKEDFLQKEHFDFSSCNSNAITQCEIEERSHSITLNLHREKNRSVTCSENPVSHELTKEKLDVSKDMLLPPSLEKICEAKFDPSRQIYFPSPFLSKQYLQEDNESSVNDTSNTSQQKRAEQDYQSIIESLKQKVPIPNWRENY